MTPTIRTALLPVILASAWQAPAQTDADRPESTPPQGAFQPSAGVRLEAGGKAIDVTVGHAAPYLFDIDGDGVRDLLVGEFGRERFPDDRLPESTRKKWGTGAFAQGKLRIYKNHGTNTEPRFEDFEYLKAQDQHASIPTT